MTARSASGPRARRFPCRSGGSPDRRNRAGRPSPRDLGSTHPRMARQAEWLRLGDVGTTIGGGTPKSGERSFWADGDGVLWLTPADMRSQGSRYLSRGNRDITSERSRTFLCAVATGGIGPVFESGTYRTCGNRSKSAQHQPGLQIVRTLHRGHVRISVTARPVLRRLPVGACHTTAGASRVASIPLFPTCRRHFPGGIGRCSRCSLPAQYQPSPGYRRAGFRITRFEACSAFTRVTARRVAESPSRPVGQKLKAPSPARAA